ncbi:MAG: GNAT family N-acetyltransferase [Clostridia bacterium]|jgi:predicted acetyltransferase|nr:GNAT family N-acetyltransferase [Clostridia bacterium]
MKFEIQEVKEQDKEVIYNLMQLYTYELSFFEDETTDFKLLDSGLYVMSKYVEMYWTSDKRHPYILKCDNELAGFVLARYNEYGKNEIAEFFVLNKYRRSGAGKFMANEMFELYKGPWEVRTLLKNERAQNFWRNVIREFSNNNFEEKLIRDKTRLAFYFES